MTDVVSIKCEDKCPKPLFKNRTYNHITDQVLIKNEPCTPLLEALLYTEHVIMVET